jgi:hypothetical protein
MKLYTLALLAASMVAVAQHQQGNVANAPDQKFAVPPSTLGDCQHYPMTAPKPTTKVACELVGGTWNAPKSEKSFIAALTSVEYTADTSRSVTVNSQTGRVVKISDEEYMRLQKLRQAVADEEKKIAVLHGVLLERKLTHVGTNTCLATSFGFSSCDTDRYQEADYWQFRGQWLLINLPKVH